MALMFNDGNERKNRPIGLSYTMAVKIVSSVHLQRDGQHEVSFIFTVEIINRFFILSTACVCFTGQVDTIVTSVGWEKIQIFNSLISSQPFHMLITVVQCKTVMNGHKILPFFSQRVWGKEITLNYLNFISTMKLLRWSGPFLCMAKELLFSILPNIIFLITLVAVSQSRCFVNVR